jgi:hypothetical protein
MSVEQPREMGHKGRKTIWALAAAGSWLLAVALGGCGITAQEPSAPAWQEQAATSGADAAVPTTADAGTVPWRGECTASSDCDQAAASLCGDNMEMYCKFRQLKDGGSSSSGTCECRERQVQTQDAGVISIDASVGEMP